MKTIDVEELKSIQLQILKHVDSFCKENGIKYFMCGGSLIGTVRHKGYIPWDDDIDIMMLREDYEKFIKIFSTHDNSPYILHTHKIDSSYVYPFAKIEDNRTVKQELAEVKELGIHIDLFPIDYIPESKKLQKKFYLKARFYHVLFSYKVMAFRKGRSFYKNAFLLIAHMFLKVVSFKRLANQIESIATSYYGTNTKYCGIAVWGYGIREINLLENYKNTLDASFEDMIVPIPIGFDNYLHSVYGDYMTPPPVEKQITHHSFKAWWRE